MRKLLSFPASLVLFFLLLAPASAAPLPTPKDKRIVVPSSVAGVKLGMKVPAAVAAWGDPGTCAGVQAVSCQWGDSLGATGTVGVQAGSKGTIELVTLNSRYSWQGGYRQIPSVAAELARVKTKEGIGIGSRLKAVINAYPRGVSSRAAGNTLLVYAVTKGSSTMEFTALAKNGKIIGIGLKKSTVS